MPVLQRIVVRYYDTELANLQPGHSRHGPFDPITANGLVAGKRFALEQPSCETLVGIKRGWSHLFLRYTFDTMVMLKCIDMERDLGI